MALYLEQNGTGYDIVEKQTKEGKTFCTLKVGFNTKKRVEGKFTNEDEDPFFVKAIAFGKNAKTLLEEQNEKGNYFGKFMIQATFTVTESGNKYNNFRILKVVPVTKKTVEETSAPAEADTDDVADYSADF